MWHALKTYDYRTSPFDWIKTVAVRHFYTPSEEFFLIPDSVVESGLAEEMFSKLQKARHSFATNLHAAKVPREYISDAMGHSLGNKGQITMRYISPYTVKERMTYNNLLMGIVEDPNPKAKIVKVKTVKQSLLDKMENFSHIGEVHFPKDFGRVMGALSKDVLDDFLKEHGGSYAALDKCEQKSLNKELNKLCTALVKQVYMSQAYIME